MNREEAIEKIKRVKGLYAYEGDYEALDMAIEALQAKTDGDLISRQDAIRWVKTECNPFGKPTLDFESGKRVIEHLEQMPSAETPTLNEKHQLSAETPTTDLISRADAIKAIESRQTEQWIDADVDYNNGLESAVAESKALPSADRPSGEWVPCSERLPSKDGCYLVTTTGTNNDIIDIAYYTEEIWHKASHIKAWMPLPKPYCPNCGAKMGGK